MPRVVAIADSDSYLKWSAATLDALPAEWPRTQWLIRNPVQPSDDQVRAATRATVDRLGLAQVLVRLRRDPPDVLLLAATGPVVHSILAAGFLRRAGRRPVLICGLPGISVPATGRAIEFRAGCDLFILHSHREIDEFTDLAHQLRIPVGFVLANLPFIKQARDSRRVTPESAGIPTTRASEPGKIVFAAQAKVPEELADRQHLLRGLSRLGDDRRVVIKLRALPGEQQTHRERLPYTELWTDLVRSEGLAADRVEFAGGSMADALADADGFVTVSSTAALEAIGLDVPILVLSDFGVSAETINEVFVDSGCLGTLTDLAAGRLRTPRPEWMQQNYFHPPEEADWIDRITDLLRQRDASGLPARSQVEVDGRRRQIRRQLRLIIPPRLLRTSGRLLRGHRRLLRRLVASGR